MDPRRRRSRRALALLAVVTPLVGAAGACSLEGLDSDFTEGDALGPPDASLTPDAAPPLDADAARDVLPPPDAGDAGDAADADAADGHAALRDGEAGGGKVVCPKIDAGLAVCDDSPAHAMPTIHCADAGSPMAADFYACGTSFDCMNGSLCVDEGFCKPTCTTSIECADDPNAVTYGATSCNPITK